MRLSNLEAGIRWERCGAVRWMFINMMGNLGFGTRALLAGVHNGWDNGMGDGRYLFQPLDNSRACCGVPSAGLEQRGIFFEVVTFSIMLCYICFRCTLGRTGRLAVQDPIYPSLTQCNPILPCPPHQTPGNPETPPPPTTPIPV